MLNVYEEIFKDEKRIAFAIDVGGQNDSGFAGYISRNYWPELANMKIKMGTVLTKKIDGREYFALCCYSVSNGWDYEKITKCFKSIPGNEPVVSIVGTDILSTFSGADFQMLMEAVGASKKQVIICNLTA